VDVLGTGAAVIVTAILTSCGQWLVHRREIRRIELEHSSKVETSRDDLTIELLSNARSEVVVARSEMEGLRTEVHSLRAIEQHFYHFEQSLEHLEAVLAARSSNERKAAERNARAFLTRMRRLQEAKGTIANETQRLDAGLSQTEKKIRKEGGQVPDVG
jgi:hypothetical protein